MWGGVSGHLTASSFFSAAYQKERVKSGSAAMQLN